MQESKICFKCEVHQPMSEFYKHSAMADGYLNKCKNCAKKDTKENSIKNYQYYRDYDNARANIPSRVEARYEYAKTDAGRQASAKARLKWDSLNSIKKMAATLIRRAICSGKIIKEYSCSVCGGSGRIEGHHDNYNFPLVVRWLCSQCHCNWHKENGQGIF